MVSPCKDCKREEKSIYCHITCKDYIYYKEKIVVENARRDEIRKKERVMDYYKIDTVSKAREKRRRK
jgi:hypothetical protein